jgi:hypothetical protein
MTVVGYAMIVAYGIKVSLEQDRIMKASYHWRASKRAKKSKKKRISPHFYKKMTAFLTW